VILPDPEPPRVDIGQIPKPRRGADLQQISCWVAGIGFRIWDILKKFFIIVEI
jgi:hypothetical protein